MESNLINKINNYNLQITYLQVSHNFKKIGALIIHTANFLD